MVETDPNTGAARAGSPEPDSNPTNSRQSRNENPLVTPPTARVEQVRRWSQRNPVMALALALGAVWVLTVSVMAPALWVQLDRTEKARKDAEDSAAREAKQRLLAEENERQANANWSHALAKEAEAVKGALAANENAAARRENQTAALRLAVKLIEDVLKKVQTRKLVLAAAPEARELREVILALARERMALLAEQLQKRKGGDTDFASLEVFSLIGDILRRIGQGEDALRYDKQGVELARQLAARNKDDRSRANLAAMVLRLGEVEREWYADPRAARDHCLEAIRLRQDVIDHPVTNVYTPLDHAIALSFSELALGRAELDLGNPTAAREHLQRAVEYRTKWVQEKPDQDGAKSALVRAWMWRGVSSWHLNDAAGVRESFDKAIESCDARIKKNPTAFGYKGDLAEVLGYQGDAWLRLGKVDDARKSYDESLKNLRLALAGSPDEVSYQAVLARTEDRLAALAVLDNKPDDALAHRTAALKLWKELRELDPNNLPWQGATFRTSAYCGEGTEAVQLMDQLVQKNPASPVLQLDAARCYAACAATTKVPDQRGEFVRRAVAAVRAAAAAGYKDHFALRTDPDLAPLRDDPDFKALLTAMGG